MGDERNQSTDAEEPLKPEDLVPHLRDLAKKLRGGSADKDSDDKS